MNFELSRWRGLNDALTYEERVLASPRALETLHEIAREHVARDLLRALNADDDDRKPFWTMAESAAWDARSRFARKELGARIIGTVPGRDLCLQLAHSDIGYYLTSYAIHDSVPLFEAITSMRTLGGGALAWTILTSATKFVALVAKDEQLGAFFDSWFGDEPDLWYGDPETGLGLVELTDSGLIRRWASHIHPGLLSSLPETSAVAALADVIESLDGGPRAIAFVSESLRNRIESPRSRDDEIYRSTLDRLDMPMATSSILIGAIISQLAAIPPAIALVAALHTEIESAGQDVPAPTGTIFGLLEQLISELERTVFEEREQTLRRLEEVAGQRDVALDVVAWAFAEHRRLSALCEQLRSERDLLGEQLRAEQRRRQLEVGALRDEVDESVRQQALDSNMIRELNAFIDTRQRRRLREAMRDVVAGASLGGALGGSVGAIAGAILGLLGAVADDAREP